jgi:hypothetical protein
LTQIDTAFGLSFLDIEVAFKIVVLGIFNDFSKGTKANRDFAIFCPSAVAPRNKTDIGAGEIDPADILRFIEVRRVAKPRTGKISSSLEGSTRKIGFSDEART